MRNFSILIILVVALASCKSQRQVSKTPPAPIQKELAEQTPADTIPETPEVVEPEPLDTVLITLKRVFPDTIKIKAVGDIMLGTNFPSPSYLPPSEGRGMLTQISDMLTGADILFGNLEGVILNEGGDPKNCRNPKTCYIFRSPEYMLSRMDEAGFNLFSVANNHAGDFGLPGRINTSRSLDSLGLWWAGNEQRPYTIFRDKGMIYGFAAFAPNKGTPSINNIDSARRTVQHLDSLVDVIIISFHGGAEGSKYTSVPREHEYFYGEDRGDVYKFSHELIDAGADVILGHGPHVPRAIEIYKNRLIAYSLGNFATYGRFNLRGVNGLAPILSFEIGPDGKFLSGRIISAKQVGAGIPVPDPEQQSLNKIKELTKKDFPEVELSFDESGEILYIHR